MEKFNFDKLMDVINYYDVQKDFLTINENEELESFDFRTLEESGVDEDNFPDNFNEFLKHNIKLDKIVLWASDNDGREPILYWFNKDDNCIEIDSDNFTMKEALTIINLVMEHQRLNRRWCHRVSFAKELDKKRTIYAQESTAFGCWWNSFIKFYQKNMNKIDMVFIDLGLCEGRSIDITLSMKKEDK